MVARCGAGLDNVDTRAAAAAGVAVVHAPGLTTSAVAEHALMLMLALARRVVEVDTAVKAGRWNVRDGFESTELRGKRMGVIGLGAIGTKLAGLRTDARHGRGLCDASGSGRRRRAGWSRRAARHIRRRATLRPAERLDTIDDRRGAVRRDEAGCAVGEHVEGCGRRSCRPCRRARRNSLGGYATDVWDPEPPRADDALLSDRRVLVTPHVAGLTDVTYREICVRPAEAVTAILTGIAPDPRWVSSPPAEQG